jgi:glycosyltransferase involved in cell wall biosynthesis
MHIGFDAKRAFHNNTGLGNYSRDTIGIMAMLYPDNSYVLYDPKPNTGKRFADNLLVKIVGPKNKLHQKLGFLWRSSGIKQQLVEDGIDLYHGLSNELPVGISKTKVKSVVTIHDVIFMRFPELYPRIDRIIYQKKTVRACQEADVIVAISEQTSQDLQFYFKVPKSKIKVVYQGCHPIFKKESSGTEKSLVREKYGIPNRFLLNVGRIEKRKNILHLLASLNQIEDIPLVIVGKPTDFQKEIENYIIDNGLEKRVQILNNVPLSDLACLYQLAEMFVYPSIFEGFGIPIIEALFSGTPVISSTGSCFMEAGGAGGIYVDPDNVVDLSNVILDLWNNPQKQQEMVDLAQNHLLQFEEISIGKNMNVVYQKAIKG